MLHRRYEIAAGSDPLWHVTQVRPAPGGLVVPIRTETEGRLIWYGIGYDGAAENSNPVDTTAGLSFDARLVYAAPGSGGLALEYIGLASIVETSTAEIPSGRIATELDLPAGLEGWLQIISVTNATAATHIWLSYGFTRRVP